MKVGLVVALMMGLASVSLAAQEPEDKPISLQLEEATIQKAIEMLAKKVGFQYVISWPQGQVPPVITLTVIDRSWKEALDLIVKEAKMVYEVEDGVYKIRPRPTPITSSAAAAATAPPSPPPPPTPPPPKATRVQKRDKTQEKEKEAEVPLGKPKPQLIPVKHLSAPIVAYLLGGQALYEWMFNPMGGGYGGGYGGYGSSGFGSSYGSSGWGGSGSSWGSSGGGWGGSGSSWGSGRSGSSWGGGGSFGRR